MSDKIEFVDETEGVKPLKHSPEDYDRGTVLLCDTGAWFVRAYDSAGNVPCWSTLGVSRYVDDIAREPITGTIIRPTKIHGVRV